MLAKIRDDFAVYGANSSSRLARYCVACTTLGFYVVVLHRLSAGMLSLGVVGVVGSRFIDFLSNVISGCYISPKAKVGGGLFLPHAVGIVIGEVAIGNGCTIYQNVTLGSSSIGANAYPDIGANVVIFANAVIVGRVVVGDGARVGASTVVLKDVPPGGLAVGNPARISTIGRSAYSASGRSR